MSSSAKPIILTRQQLHDIVHEAADLAIKQMVKHNRKYVASSLSEFFFKVKVSVGQEMNGSFIQTNEKARVH